MGDTDEDPKARIRQVQREEARAGTTELTIGLNRSLKPPSHLILPYNKGKRGTRWWPMFRQKKRYENLRSLIIWLGLAELAMRPLIGAQPVDI